MYRYRVYDLLVASELALPEWAEADDDGAPDVEVRLGGVPERPAAPVEARVTWAAQPGLWWQEVPGVARFAVTDGGRSIRVEARGGSDAEVRAFLHDAPVEALLHARGLFPLTGAAVALPEGAALLVGQAGAGTSTTAAALAQRGHPPLGDGRAVVRFGPGGPEVLPGGPTLTLWNRALDRLGLEREAYPLVREGRARRLVPAAVSGGDPVALRAVVVLARRREAGGDETTEAGLEAPALDGLRVGRPGAHAAVATLLRLTAQPRIAAGLGLQADHFRWAARLAGAVPVSRIVRDPAVGSVPAVADLVERAVAAGLEAPAGAAP